MASHLFWTYVIPADPYLLKNPNQNGGKIYMGLRKAWTYTYFASKSRFHDNCD